MVKAKILVVEDDSAISNLIRTTLETQNYQYHTAKTGAGALLDAASYRPDIIILDLGLPDMDGVEVIQKVRGWTNTPIIVVSARSEDQDKVDALDAGADDCAWRCDACAQREKSWGRRAALTKMEISRSTISPAVSMWRERKCI